ncbi:MAG: SPOR domain-containing protein [Polaromonas sp.]|uniref:SPOR domain-containing protein n=1 Tax=Polaromonas sp. TaxID=1869339 RepID=UPI002731D096|nr:SPOR domain-containing protein [Polaromonas sp.]MDP1742777.1 SPOR domain-containing protein [Polaromonas sp.]MDP1955526.1 SPOR domain-containing protein [Polaromonas sp.]MDP3753364.1 SPOR domain-containing protein [Polaromonas sp.]
MPFFNFRRGQPAAASAGSGAQTESVDVIRRRAKHRLIGAVVLVLAGVIGFPLLFDTQPRPVAVDIPIEIPSKAAVKPLAMPGPVAAPAQAASGSVAAASGVAAPASLTPREEIVTDKKAAAQTSPAPAAIKNEAKTEPAAEPKPLAKAPAASAASDDGSRAKALLDGKVAAAASAAKTVDSKPAAAEAEGRHVVQVGAFADADKARDVRQKLEKAGLKTYTQVAETKDGKRIRVRVGPFDSKADADKAASKIKSLDLPAAVLTL